jgi:transcription termination factor Rho
MSVDSTALERSALESKDRDELITIAKALGGKPPARAKKADIVDLVLSLTGVSGDAAPDAGADGPSDEPGADPAPKAESTPAPSKARAPRARKAPAKRSRPEEPPAEWEVEAAAESSNESDEGGTRRAGGRNGQPGRQDRNSDPDRQKGQGGGQGQGGQGQGGQGQGGSDQSGGDQGDDDEGGNRRRRRRGRNRDRGGDGQGGQADEFTGEPIEVEGHLDLRDEGYGFLRLHGYLPSRDDVYVSVKQARQFGLRRGDHLAGASRPALRNEKNPALLRIDRVNGDDPEKARERPRFEDLTPLFPDSRLTLENPSDPSNMTARIVDLIAPIGKGQRGLIVSPPKAGKTTIMKQIARSIETNDPEVHLFVLLVDERPEEVTDMRRWLKSDRSTVVASTFDRPTEEHIQVAELTIERAKRLVEDGADVVIILDGITRLSRAYNLHAPTTGRVMSGGIDTGALYPPKKFFGAARNVEEGGSLTILATALVETGSRMDEVIFEEFKGTGNMELRLDRRLAERRVYPAIDVDASSTRHEELLFLGTQLQQVWKLRRVLSGMAHDGGSGAGLELLTDRMKTFKTNAEFLAEIAKAAG